MTQHRLLAGLLALGLTGAAGAESYLAANGKLEMRVEALPSTSLSPEASRDYRVEPAPDRGLLTVRITRNGRPGKAEMVPAQVYAGAMTRNNMLLSIPVREVREGNSVYYLGEFRVTPPDELRFLVNANVLGSPLKAEFSRAFPNN
ncbi:MAG: DUF4426 domain-containing protein [Thiobacillaceae bacterium]|nr:DUF4426 domain-containing protein [Thiobacillaceae bacterium]